MSKKHILFLTTFILSFCFLPEANGIQRDIDVAITQNGQDLQADVSGTFMFPGMAFNIEGNTTTFPVPPDATNIEIQEEISNPGSWTWSGNIYQTLYLPEESNWPMIQWNLLYFSGPEFPITITYHIHYEHTLIKRGGKYVFFYADESFELFAVAPDGCYPNGMFSAMGPLYPEPQNCIINFPQGYSIGGVWSRDVPLEYQVNGNQLTFLVDYLHPDRITVEIKPPCAYELAGDLNDDCVVNFADFVMMANNWLIDCYEDPANPECTPKN